MIRRLLPLAVTILTACTTAPPHERGQHAQRFTGTVTRSVTMPYLLHLPSDYPARAPYPVILYLHGGSVRGTDIAKLRRIGLPARLEKEPAFPFIVVSPLLPAFHGVKDTIVPIVEGAALVAASRRAGTNVRYSRFEDRDHFILDIYDGDEVFEWFLDPEDE